eukprot:TRINITY_DN2365_c0_g1_i2.p1 TRINITY_DN2365_c0_g1~~TRINITY_DN2365_c0_g1_i2.p1  ORF type:complete len:215 (+),score=73.29 TRINITY_DN2365_c0_g1_i2:128-772(+)
MDIISEKTTNLSQKGEGKLIIALGASLTWGYYKNGLKQHPYSWLLEKLLKEEKKDEGYRVVEYGLSGEKTGQMKERIKMFKESEDLVGFIILGGSNDLGSILTSEEIAENLKEMLHYVIFTLKKKCVIVSLPDNEFVNKFPLYDEKRVNINLLSSKYCGENPSLSRYVDVTKVINMKNKTKEEKEEMWDDHIHLTPFGYDELAKEIFKQTKDFF